MPNNKQRWSVRQFMGRGYIHDSQADAYEMRRSVYAFGYGLVLPYSYKHRGYYSEADAQAVADYMNERETWKPLHC